MTEAAKELSPLELIEAKRAARKAKHQAEYELQRAVDLEALDELEIEHGDANVASLDVPFAVGQVTLVAVRLPKPAEVKRFRARVKDTGRKKADPVAGTEELGESCAIYPAAEALQALLAERPAVLSQMGVAALKLATANAEAEGND